MRPLPPRARRAPPRASVLAVSLVFAFAAGALSARLWPRDARAQASLQTSVLVPWEGLVFRTPDGTAIARLSRDAHGGLFELYGDRQNSVAPLSSAAQPASRPATREPYVAADDDPWKSTKSERTPRPGPGF